MSVTVRACRDAAGETVSRDDGCLLGRTSEAGSR